MLIALFKNATGVTTRAKALQRSSPQRVALYEIAQASTLLLSQKDHLKATARRRGIHRHTHTHPRASPPLLTKHPPQPHNPSPGRRPTHAPPGTFPILDLAMYSSAIPNLRSRSNVLEQGKIKEQERPHHQKDQEDSKATGGGDNICCKPLHYVGPNPFSQYG